MIAKQRIEVVIGGVLLAVPVGGVVHPAIIESWRVAGKLERAIAQGVIADETTEPRAEPAKKTIAGNPIGTRSIKKDAE